jgi:hypothetical protein
MCECVFCLALFFLLDKLANVFYSYAHKADESEPSQPEVL